MAWTGGSTKSTGDIISATIWNNYLGASGSIEETAPAKVTTAGDLVYGTGTNAIARLAVGTASQVLVVNSGATAPEWGSVVSSAIAGTGSSSGQVLTSTGSGTAPTWQDSVGGDEMSFTANGAITAGRAASLDSDGKVSQTIDSLSGNSIGSFTQWYSTGWHSAYGNPTVYDRNNSDHHLVLGQDYQGTSPYYQGMQGVVVQSNSANTSATFSSTSLNSVNVDNNGFDNLNAWYDDTANVCLVARRSGTNAMPYIQACTTSGTGSGASITYGTDTQISSSTASYGGMGLYIPDLGYSLYFYGQSGGGSDDGLFYNTITPSGTGSPTIGTQQRIYTTALNSTYAGISASYDDANNVITVIFKSGSSTTDMLYICGTVSGGSITWGTAATLTTLGANDNSCVLSYRSADSRWFAMWSHASSNEIMTACGTWSSGTTISWSVKEWTSADGAIYKINYPMMEMRDNGLSLTNVFGLDYTSGYSATTYMFSFALSGGDYVFDSDYPKMPNDASGTTGSTQFGYSYSPDTGKMVAAQWVWANPYSAAIYEPVTGSTTAAFTIGAAQSTVSDGDTVKVKSIGTTSSVGLSGLTVREKVYVQGDGTLTNTSSTTQIGVAVAADTVLITKIGANVT